MEPGALDGGCEARRRVAERLDLAVGEVAGEAELPPLADVRVGAARPFRGELVVVVGDLPAAGSLGAEDALELVHGDLVQRVVLVDHDRPGEERAALLVAAGRHRDLGGQVTEGVVERHQVGDLGVVAHRRHVGDAHVEAGDAALAAGDGAGGELGIGVELHELDRQLVHRVLELAADHAQSAHDLVFDLVAREPRQARGRQLHVLGLGLGDHLQLALHLGALGEGDGVAILPQQHGARIRRIALEVQGVADERLAFALRVEGRRDRLVDELLECRRRHRRIVGIHDEGRAVRVARRDLRVRQHVDVLPCDRGHELGRPLLAPGLERAFARELEDRQRAESGLVLLRLLEQVDGGDLAGELPRGKRLAEPRRRVRAGGNGDQHLGRRGEGADGDGEQGEQADEQDHGDFLSRVCGVVRRRARR